MESKYPFDLWLQDVLICANQRDRRIRVLTDMPTNTPWLQLYEDDIAPGEAAIDALSDVNWE